ncbi:MAG: hypothetical protein GXO88_08400 [Chlorobi bacterium]|nr:hypothetical protein [Chlorobiota bacterium]
MIQDIAYKLNELSADYKIGSLQEIRKLLKQKKRRPGSCIFHSDTINNIGGWAYHYGGRKELQFNIGFEEEGLRYGVALSLESSRTLPNIEELFPNARRLNQFIRINPGFFNDFYMWYWQNGQRSDIGQVKEISEDLLKPKTFIFIGKIQKKDEIDYHNILATFDNLLKPYVFVEKTIESGIAEDDINEDSEFIFNRHTPNIPTAKNYSVEAKNVNLDIRHSLIQKALVDKLINEYGKDNVSWEHPIGGKRIDVVLKDDDGYVFYEVKVRGSAKACIREALGQLLEYAFWPGKENASSLVVVGEEEIDNNTLRYIDYLNRRFLIPIKYEKISIDEV